MHYDCYDIEESHSSLKFEFESIGPKGNIKKRVLFILLNELLAVYNLGFGDVDKNDVINDEVVTGNNDS
jgi:hypothetical protein